METAGRPRPRLRPLDERAAEHAVLSSPTRLQLLDLLRAAPGPLPLDDLARQVGLNRNTVRGHLDILEDDGFVSRHPERTGRAGRPRMRYGLGPRAAASQPAGGHCLGYLALAGALSDYLEREANDPADAGRQAGWAWGHRLAADRAERRLPPSAALDLLEGHLAQAGFAAGVHRAEDGADVVQGACPFGPVATDAPSVVCALHLGLVDGLLTTLGAPFEVGTVSAAVGTVGCVIQLRHRRRSV